MRGIKRLFCILFSGGVLRRRWEDRAAGFAGQAVFSCWISHFPRDFMKMSVLPTDPFAVGEL